MIPTDVRHDAHRGSEKGQRQVNPSLFGDGDLRDAVCVGRTRAQQEAADVVRAIQRPGSLLSSRKMTLEDAGEQVLGRCLARASCYSDERGSAKRSTVREGELIHRPAVDVPREPRSRHSTPLPIRSSAATTFVSPTFGKGSSLSTQARSGPVWQVPCFAHPMFRPRTRRNVTT